MSASTGTIQRSMAGGSVLRAVVLGGVTLVATVGLAWGALNLTATKQAATPVAAPAWLDRGGRELQAAPAPAPTHIDRAQQDFLRAQAKPFVGDSLVGQREIVAKPFVGDSLVGQPDVTIPRTSHTTHPRHLGPR